MKNFILQHTRGAIPYVPQLMPMAGSLTGCIVMQQLDFYFSSNPNGFYKFQSPCSNPLYRPGDSWEECLGISKQEFRTVFDKIGTRYPSKKAFEAATDKFAGKYYACYTDKRSYLTYYFRNHEKMDRDLYVCLVENPAQTGLQRPQNNQFSHQNAVSRDTQFTVSRDTQFTVNCVSQSTVSGDTQFTVGCAPQSTVSRDTQPHTTCDTQHREVAIRNSGITENYRDTKKQQPQNAHDANAGETVPTECGSSGDSLTTELQELIFPAKALPAEIDALQEVVAQIPPEYRQDVLDELEGKQRANKVTTGLIPLAVSLMQAVKRGTFTASAGVNVRAERIAAAQTRQRVAQAAAPSELDLEAIDPKTLAGLPAGIRKRVEAQMKAGRV